MRPAPVLQTTFHLNDSGSILSSKADFPKSLIGSTGLGILLFRARRNPLKKAKTDIKKTTPWHRSFPTSSKACFLDLSTKFRKKDGSNEMTPQA